MIVATNSGSDYTPVESGNHIARCYGMIHIGTIVENFKGEPKRVNKVRITWELPELTKEFRQGEGEKPYSISKDFTLSMNEKSNLRKFLEGWRGKSFTEDEAKAFDVATLIGVPCMLNIIHKVSAKGKTYADISSASKLPKSITAPPPFYEHFELNYTEAWDETLFNSLPDFIRDKMKESEEYKRLMSKGEVIDDPELLEDESEDDLPF
jgi:hypothetical protein